MSEDARTKYILGRVKELLAPDINGNDSKFTPKTAAAQAAAEYDAVSGGDDDDPTAGISGDYSDAEILAEIERRRGEAQRGASAVN
jgi:hypothetical protein